MFFFKKKAPKEDPQAGPANRRHYRKTQSRSQPLSVGIKVSENKTVNGELVDLSVQGAGIRVLVPFDPKLNRDHVVEVIIGSFGRGDVKTPARVCSRVVEGPQSVKYGVEFINLGNLYSQLDSFYARVFNRRRVRRVKPSFDRKIKVAVSWRGGVLPGSIYDISCTGMGLTLPLETDEALIEDVDIGLSFKLPGLSDHLSAKAIIKHRTTFGHHVLLGVHFDVDDPTGISGHLETIRRFVEQRTEAMAKWEDAIAGRNS